MNRTARKTALLVVFGAGGVAVFLVLASLGMLGSDPQAIWQYVTWTESRVARSQRVGDAIIVEIKKFREDRGQFPERLDELTPEYLETIPPPLAGSGQWHYERRDEGASYMLQFQTIDTYPCCFFESTYGKWYVDQ